MDYDGELQLVTVTKVQLRNLISEELKQGLDGIKRELKQKEEDVILTREEAAKLLSVGESTLCRWTKKGILLPYGIGGRIYYKRSDIDNALVKLS